MKALPCSLTIFVALCGCGSRHATAPNVPTPANPIGSVFRQGVGGVGHAKCVRCPDPQYPKEALKAKREATVELQIIVTPDGRATNIQVTRKAGFGFDEEALEAVRHWRFKPAIGPDGKPVAVEMSIDVIFKLLKP